MPHAELMIITPQIGVPYVKGMNALDLYQKATAACNTANTLAEYGLNIRSSKEDREVARIMMEEYAKDPLLASKALSNPNLAGMRPGAIVQIGNILDEYGMQVVANAMHLRHYVTNKLVIHSDDKDPKISLRALELLGKVTDVGLFTEKSEITVRHETDEDLRNKLRDKLHSLRKRAMPQEQEIEDAVIIDA